MESDVGLPILSTVAKKCAHTHTHTHTQTGDSSLIITAKIPFHITHSHMIVDCVVIGGALSVLCL